MSDSFDLDAIINGGAATGAKTKKVEVPTMKIGAKDQLELVNTWIQANKAIDEHTANKKTAEAKLIPIAKNFHIKNLSAAREVNAAIILEATDTPKGSEEAIVHKIIVDVAKNQYKKVPVTDKGKLAAIFDPQEPGKEITGAPTPVTDRLFARTTDIELTPEALADKEIMTKLVLAVGQENFKKYFKVTVNLVPTPVFHSARFLDTALVPKINEAIEAGLVTPYAPSFKAKA